MNEEMNKIEKKVENLETKAKKNTGKLIYLAVAIVGSLVALFMTKNFIYFILAAALFTSIYFIINSKENITKLRVALLSMTVSGIIGALSLFAYFYSKWILPFMLKVLDLPAFDNVKETASLEKVAQVFLVIGLVFAFISIIYSITWYILRKKESQKKLV